MKYTIVDNIEGTIYETTNKVSFERRTYLLLKEYQRCYPNRVKIQMESGILNIISLG